MRSLNSLIKVQVEYAEVQCGELSRQVNAGARQRGVEELVQEALGFHVVTPRQRFGVSINTNLVETRLYIASSWKTEIHKTHKTTQKKVLLLTKN